ncbi:hypothetical protein BC937DRAFT_88398 [Endogone sp. FLAS-F59071]|nr:hypothetical protein BC937DRAFT_88398 [Endogone sp. FLAS-F59071]|eukprot:RUS18747.1 hypothetical protein BC937DRAFT_88398 [Endogone sp. FLAS-F59071]
MDPAARLAVNLSVLRRHDNTIEEILDSSSHVCVYKFDGAQGAWAKKGVEGTMFVFKRSKSPTYGVFVLNRLGIDNYSTFLTKGLEIQLTEEYIIYRTEDGMVRRSGKRLRELANDTLPLNPSPPSVPTSANNTPADQPPNSISSDPTPPQYGKSIDILSLFKQAAAPTQEQDSHASPPQPMGDPAPQPAETTSTHIPPTTASASDLLGQLFFKATLSDQSAAPAAPIVDPANPMYVPSPANNLTRHDPASAPLQLQPSSSTTAKSVMDGRSLLALLQHPDAAVPPSNPSGPTQQPHLYASSFSPPSTSSVFPPAFPLRVSGPHAPPSAAASFSQPFGPHETSAYRPLSPKGVGPSTTGIGLMGLRTLGGAPPLVPGRAFDITKEEIGRRFLGGGMGGSANGVAIGANGVFAAGAGGKVMSKPEFIQQFLNLVQNDPSFLDSLYDGYVTQLLSPLPSQQPLPPQQPLPLPIMQLQMPPPPPPQVYPSAGGGFYPGAQMR